VTADPIEFHHLARENRVCSFANGTDHHYMQQLGRHSASSHRDSLPCYYMQELLKHILPLSCPAEFVHMGKLLKMFGSTFGST